MTRYTVIEENTCDDGVICILCLCILIAFVLPIAAIYGLILLCARSFCRPCCIENCPGLECCWGPSCLCIEAAPSRRVVVAPDPKPDVTVNQIVVNQNTSMQAPPVAYPPPPMQYGMGGHPVGYAPQQQLAGVHGMPTAGVHGMPTVGAYVSPAAMPSTTIPPTGPAAAPNLVPQAGPAAMPHPDVPNEPPPTYTK